MKEEKGLNASGAYAVLMGLGAVVMFFTASRTLHFLQQTLPTSMQYVAYLGLACFDLGMVIWLWYAVTSARGVNQRVVAYGMVFVCLLGVAVTTVVDIFIVSAQNGMNNAVPAQFSTLGLWVVCGVICINVLALVLVHFADPSHKKHMVMEKARDQIHTAVYAAIEQKAQMISPQIATAAAEHWSNQVVAEMIGYIPTGNLKLPSPSSRTVTGTLAKPKTKQIAEIKSKKSSKNLSKPTKKSSKNLKNESVSLSHSADYEEDEIDYEELDDLAEEEQDTEELEEQDTEQPEEDEEMDAEEDTQPESVLVGVKKKIARVLAGSKHL